MSDAAHKAARGLNRDFGELAELQVAKKAPADFVSAADLKAEQVIFETTVPAATERGHATLAIPQEAVPTFNGRNNRIRWLIDLRAGVPRLPDVNAERELLVHAPVREEQP